MADTATARPGPDVAMAITPAIPDDDENPIEEADFENLTDVEAEGLREWMKGQGEEPEPEQEETADDEATAAAAADAEAQAAEARKQRETPPEPVKVDLTDKIAAKDAELAGIREKNQELLAQWNDGEIAEDEFNRQMRENESQIIALSSELGGLRGMQTTLTASAEAQTKQAQDAELQEWGDAVNAFKGRHDILFSKEHYDGFNKTVQTVTRDPRVAALPFEEQLKYAAERYTDDQRRFGGPVPELGNAPPKPATSETEPQPKPTRREPPVTLAQVPNSAADPNQSQIEALAHQISRADDPDARERLVAGIPDDKLEQVMALLPD